MGVLPEALVKAVRVKTVFFKKDGMRAPGELATVVASTLWRLADKLVDNLSKADYDIITPARGFKLIAEVLAIGLHLCDRWAYGRLGEAQRVELVQTVAGHLADTMERNVRELVGEDGRDYRGEFIDMLNRRGADYATFDIPESGDSFPALRYLAAQIREDMEETDRRWVMDQIMEIEMPEVIGTLKKTVDGLLAPRAH
jgi:hypothetical protein